MALDLQSEELIRSLILEASAVIASGILAYAYHRWILGRRTDHPWQFQAISLRTLLLLLRATINFTAAWFLILLVASLILEEVMQGVGLIWMVLATIGFFILFQILSVGIRVLLPRHQFSRFMFQLAIAIAIVLLAGRTFNIQREIMEFVEFHFIRMGPASISLGVILKSVFLVWILFLLAEWATAFLRTYAIKRTEIDPSLSFAMMRFLKFFLFGIGILVVLDTVGVDMSTLTVFGGALGIGLGFGLQNIANNLVSGMILLLDRSIKQGDVITVGDSYGWVVRLGARYIVVRTRDGVEKLIPNANLIASEITNWSHSDRAVRLHVKVGVSYQADPFMVRDLLLHIADAHPRVLKKPPPNVLLMDFGDSAIEFELRIWINDPEGGIESVRSAVRFEIWKALKENGVEIPYPQRDIHIRSELGEPYPGKPAEIAEEIRNAPSKDSPQGKSDGLTDSKSVKS